METYRQCLSVDSEHKVSHFHTSTLSSHKVSTLVQLWLPVVSCVVSLVPFCRCDLGYGVWEDLCTNCELEELVEEAINVHLRACKCLAARSTTERLLPCMRAIMSYRRQLLFWLGDREKEYLNASELLKHLKKLLQSCLRARWSTRL